MISLLDTNLLTDFPRTIPAARDRMHRFTHKAIGIISRIEITAATQGAHAFVDGFALSVLTIMSLEHAVALQQAHRLKLPDAIIWVSAQAYAMLLVTRDGQNFPLIIPACS